MSDNAQSHLSHQFYFLLNSVEKQMLDAFSYLCDLPKHCCRYENHLHFLRREFSKIPLQMEALIRGRCQSGSTF
jgi:hypothetical protein